MKLLVNKDPELRPSAADLLKHPLMEQWIKLYSYNSALSPRDHDANPSFMKSIPHNLNSSSD